MADAESMPDVMTVEETAAYLRVSKDTIYALARKGAIPARRVGTNWRFSRRVLGEWLSGRKPTAGEQGKPVTFQRKRTSLPDPLTRDAPSDPQQRVSCDGSPTTGCCRAHDRDPAGSQCHREPGV